jgi:choline kinase
LKVIILAAGQGTRLRPHTNDKPKCLVEVEGKAILDYQLESFERLGLNERFIVTGYKQDKVQRPNLHKVTNIRYDETNMVHSLFCAEEYFDDDIIISYGDIIYSDSVLSKLVQAEGEFAVVVDKNWNDLWSLRMDNPEDDVESMKIKDGYIVELGKKISNLKDVEGQYIGLIKIQKQFLPILRDFYNSLDKSILYDGNDFDNMYMTSLIQMVIDHFHNVTPIFIEGEWAEVDTISDLNIYSQNKYIHSFIK